MPISTSRVVTVQVAETPTTYLGTVAASLAPGEWSSDLTVANLDYEFPRTWTDPGIGTISSDATKDYPTHANDKQCWSWTSKALYDPVTMRVMWVNCPAIETGHPWATLLTVYDLQTNQVVIYQDPLGGRVVGHGFDNNGIALSRRRLYKHAYHGTGANAAYTTGEVIGLDLDAITTNRASAEFGAAIAEILPNTTATANDRDGSSSTAGGMDYHPNMGSQGSLLWFWQTTLKRYDLASGGYWSNVSTALTPTVADGQSTIHCVGHYNPNSDLFLFGGGSYIGANKASKALWTIDANGAIVKRDSAPFVLSVNQQQDTAETGAHKVNFVPHPTKPTDICIRCVDEIWEFDYRSAPGSQWQQVGSVPNDFTLSAVPSISCTIPELGVILVFRYADNGQAKMRLYKPV